VIRCQRCGAETSNGLALCDLCQQYGHSCFEFLPVYFRNLARWRPGRTGSRPVPGSRVLYDGSVRGTGTGDRISDTLDETANALTTWARVLADARTFPRPLSEVDAVLCGDLPADFAEVLSDRPELAVDLLCRGFGRHLTSVATTDWCGAFLAEIGERETRLRKMTEVSVPGWYAGACRHCGVSTYVVPGLTWVKCSHPVVMVGEDGKRRTVDLGCGTTTHAATHLETVLDEAREWVDRPKALAEALVALLDTEPSVPRLYDRIRKWAEREQLTPIRRLTRGHTFDPVTETIVVVDEEVGPARYRLGDVLDLVLATRGKAEPSESAAAVG